MRPKIILTVAGLCLGLGACGDEPSESAMYRAATETIGRLHQGQAQAAAFLLGGARGGIPRAPTVTAFRKIGCVSAQPKPGHTCDFELAIDGIPRSKNRGRFFTAPGGALEMGE